MAQEEEVLGKAYDSRLMKRLLQYLRPYKWPVGISLVSILIKAGADVLGPYLVSIEIDRYLVPVPKAHAFRFFSERESLCRDCSDRGHVRRSDRAQFPARLSADIFHAVGRARW